MNYGNHFSECCAALPVRKHLLSPLDPAAHSVYPVTIYPPIDAVSNARVHCHRLIELVVTFGGAHGEISVQGVKGVLHPLSIGEYQCCLLPAGVCHSIRIENRHRSVSLFVDAGAVGEAVTDCPPGVLIADLRKLAWCDPFLNQLISELDGREAVYSDSVLTHCMLTALAVKIVDGFLCVHKGCAHAAEKGMAETQQKRAHEYIETHLEEKFCVASLAKHMAMSLPHLNRLFRATFGVPPLQYVLKLRVDKALDLLRGGDARVADAAFAVGFCDQSHFDRHCRKFYGFPPGALIRAAR